MIHIRAKPTASVQSMKEDLRRKGFDLAPLTPVCEMRDMGNVLCGDYSIWVRLLHINVPPLLQLPTLEQQSIFLVVFVSVR